MSRGGVLIALPPVIDLSNIDVLRREVKQTLARDDVERVVVDLGEMTFMDSLGLGLLIDVRSRCEAMGTVLSLRNCPPTVKRLLEVAALDHLFVLEPG